MDEAIDDGNDFENDLEDAFEDIGNEDEFNDIGEELHEGIGLINVICEGKDDEDNIDSDNEPEKYIEAVKIDDVENAIELREAEVREKLRFGKML